MLINNKLQLSSLKMITPDCINGITFTIIPVVKKFRKINPTDRFKVLNQIIITNVIVGKSRIGQIVIHGSIKIIISDHPPDHMHK